MGAGKDKAPVRTATIPANVVDIENAYLGTLMRDALKPSPALKASDFFEPKNSDVYAAILELNLEGNGCDEYVVSDKLRKKRSSVAEHYVNGLTRDVGFVMHNEAWPAYIIDQADRRRLQQAARRAIESTEGGSEVPPGDQRGARPRTGGAIGLRCSSQGSGNHAPGDVASIR